MTGTSPLKVLSLNAYIMGHITHQDILEKTFRDEFTQEIEFNSLHLTDYFKKDYLGRFLYLILSKRLPGADKFDYDFNRFRIEFANSFFAMRCLQKKLEVYQPDLLHIHTQSIALLTSTLFRKFPSVVSIDYTTALLAKEHSFPANITYQPIIALEQKCFQSATHIIACSDRARFSVIDDYGISDYKVTTIHYGIPLELFKKSLSNKSSTLSKPRLLFVGNDFVRKGGEDLLAVFLENFWESCCLDIVTNASFDFPIMPNLSIHRGVRPLSSEILHLYQLADIFVMPTYEDVYGLTFLEAMAAGLPCIGTTVMAVPELVQNGYNGFTIPPGDRQALYQVLKQLVEQPNLRNYMGLNSKDLAQKKFDAISNCRQLAQVFVACTGSKEHI